MKIMTIIGTRPEIIRLACIIKKLDKYCNHILVHTGQNYDYELNGVFFKDLNLRQPDYILDVKDAKLYNQLGKILSQTGKVIEDEKPDAILVLGDTNSALSLINAKRFKIPIFHMEAGDRSFDENVPEELNRRIVDHTSDILLPYTEYSRQNLLREGIHPSKIFVVGSPINEVYGSILGKINNSKILEELNLTSHRFFTASIHREENVDKPNSLKKMIECYNTLCNNYNMPIVVSTHPRTEKRIKQLNLNKVADERIMWHKPFGLIDYLYLQTNSCCVISDSGTIHEDSSILKFPAIAIRKSTEKAESIDAGHCVITGFDVESVLNSVQIACDNLSEFEESITPEAYLPLNVSTKVVKIILGMTKIINERVWGNKDEKYI